MTLYGSHLGGRNSPRISLAGQLAFAYMSMASLLAWRGTCHANFDLVNKELRDSLEALVGRFFPEPAVFLDVITPWNALIVGEAALSHLLRHPSVCKTSLEIAIGNLFFNPFLDSLSRLLPYDTILASRVIKPPPSGFQYHRHITRVAEYRLTSGLLVIVYESCTPSACDVVSGYWTTALMNFVNAHAIGCAYPRLTLNRCAILCDTRSSTMDWADRAMSSTLDDLGFEKDVVPHNWPLYARGPTSPCRAVEGCGRDLYVCPHQGRFFGDGGSLVLFVRDLPASMKEIRELSVAPYGPMVAWRLPSTGLCKEGCLLYDKVLPPYVVSMLTVFSDYGYVSSCSNISVCPTSLFPAQDADLTQRLAKSAQRYSL